jgi:hypothetical protein
MYSRLNFFLSLVYWIGFLMILIGETVSMEKTYPKASTGFLVDLCLGIDVWKKNNNK